MKVSKLASFLLITLLPMPIVAQDNNSANIRLDSDATHIKGGSDLAFRVELNEPLPDGARFDVRLSPIGFNQELPVSSQEPTDKARKIFVLHTKLPEHSRGGFWHIAVVYLFLPGVTWTGSTIQTNEMKFYVDEPTSELPTKGTATIVK